MADEEAREEQAAELEAVEAIFGTDFEQLDNNDAKAVGCARFQVTLNDIDTPDKAAVRLTFSHTPTYPQAMPIRAVAHPLCGISAPQRKALQAHIDQVAKDSVGMPAAYTICEEAREFIVSQQGGGGGDEDEDGEGGGGKSGSKFETLDSTQRDKVEVISSKAVGTPVTVETFADWREAFLQEFVYNGKTKEDVEKEEGGEKMTGREFFESRTVVVTEESASFWESEANLVDAES